MRVLICDDHRMFGDALALVVQTAGHEVVAVVEDPGGAVAVLDDALVDVCIMDLRYRDGDGLAAIGAIARRHPSVRIVILSGHITEEDVGGLRAAGAAAWAVKGGSLDDVVRLVADDTVASATIDTVDRWSQDPLGRFLTRREREILEGVAQGESTTVLATRFGVSHATVRTHVQSILSKLGVHSRLEAVSYAVSRSLVVLQRRPEVS